MSTAVSTAGDILHIDGDSFMLTFQAIQSAELKEEVPAIHIDVKEFFL